MDREVRGWSRRKDLPHLDDGSVQFLTWRTADSLPAEVMARWRLELKDLQDAEAKAILRRRIEKWLDAGHGGCLRQNPVAAQIMQDVLIYGHGFAFDLLAWVIMPNHVHALLRPTRPIPDIVRVLKGTSSNRIVKSLGIEAPVWQADYFDRSLRSPLHLRRTIEYIEWNPVKAKLTPDPRSYPYSSAFEKFQS